MLRRRCFFAATKYCFHCQVGDGLSQSIDRIISSCSKIQHLRCKYQRHVMAWVGVDKKIRLCSTWHQRQRIRREWLFFRAPRGRGRTLLHRRVAAFTNTHQTTLQSLQKHTSRLDFRATPQVPPWLDRAERHKTRRALQNRTL